MPSKKCFSIFIFSNNVFYNIFSKCNCFVILSFQFVPSFQSTCLYISHGGPILVWSCELLIGTVHTYIYYLCMFILRLHSRANKGVTCTHVERNLRRCMCSTLLKCIGNPPLPAKYCTRLGIVLITPTHQQINFDSQYISLYWLGF